MIKLYGLIPKRPDLTDEEFHAHWASTHKELALRIRALRRYVQSHRVAGAVPGLPRAVYEGIAEVWLDDVATAMGLVDDPDYTQNAKRDQTNFIDVDRHGVIVGSEHVLRPGPPVAQDEPGVKLMLLLRRARGFSAADAVPELAKARRVVLVIPVEDGHADGATPPYDAVLEVSFADAAAFERAWAAAADALLNALEPDRSGSCALLVEELRVIWPNRGPA